MAQSIWIPIVVAFVAASISAVTDVWKYRVYNVLTIPLFLIGLTYHGVTGGLSGLSSSALGALFGFSVLMLPYLLGLMGAGDVKLMAGIGTWLCLPATVVTFVVSALVTGVIALGFIIYRGKLADSLLTIKLILYRFATIGVHLGKDDLVESLSTGADRRVRVIPFGATVPLGVLGTILWFMWS